MIPCVLQTSCLFFCTFPLSALRFTCNVLNENPHYLTHILMHFNCRHWLFLLMTSFNLGPECYSIIPVWVKSSNIIKCYRDQIKMKNFFFFMFCFGESYRCLSVFSAIYLNKLCLWCSKCQKEMHSEKQLKDLFTEIMTRLLKIIHRPCCEQFHVGTIFFTHHPTEGKLQPLIFSARQHSQKVQEQATDLKTYIKHVQRAQSKRQIKQ